MGQEAGKDAIYAFGPFCLDARKHKLTKKGRKVDLNVKPTQVLLALVEQAGKFVSKEDLLKQVWGGIAVSDDSLYQHVSVLRKALGQRPKDNKYIMTIPGGGYKFVAPVKIVRMELSEPKSGFIDEETGLLVEAVDADLDEDEDIEEGLLDEKDLEPDD
jgi:DNA-binding winged helix-turn-helix (wHTH) protein